MTGQFDPRLPSPATSVVDFVRDIKPLFLKKHFFDCHGLGVGKGGLSLASGARALEGGDKHDGIYLRELGAVLCNAFSELSRRTMLTQTGMGIGGLAMLELMSRNAGASENPRLCKTTHHPPKTKAVISLFMHGAPSHVDTFDPKPLLA